MPSHLVVLEPAPVHVPVVKQVHALAWQRRTGTDTQNEGAGWGKARATWFGEPCRAMKSHSEPCMAEVTGLGLGLGLQAKRCPQHVVRWLPMHLSTSLVWADEGQIQALLLPMP